MPLIVCLLAVLVVPVSLQEAIAREPAPNIVLIISDDHGWPDYGFMGHPAIKTPHLDKLAETSITFTRGYVPSSLCRPSLATMITGLYPFQHGITGNDPPGPRRDRPATNQPYIDRMAKLPTLPRVLAEQGYLSHQSGKWWEGHYSAGGFTHGMTHGDPQRSGRHGDEGLRIGREGMKPIFDFIEHATTENKPFFIWYAPFLPHTPHNPPQRLYEKYQMEGRSPHVARYYAMVEWFDETCGKLLDYLDEQGLANDTMVLFVSDNGWNQLEDTSGGGIGGPGAKRTPYELGIRTPIMVRWPGRMQPRRDEQTLAHSIDLMPTILAAVGIDALPDLPGANLLDADALASRDAIFGDIYAHDMLGIDQPQASLHYRWIIQDNWKLIVPNSDNKPDEIAELFDVVADPHEQNNLADDHPQRVLALRELIASWYPQADVR